MQTMYLHTSWLADGWSENLRLGQKLMFGIIGLFALLLFSASLLQALDPATGVLDMGILTVALFGLLVGWSAVYISIWLQELLWKPFKFFRQQFHQHFNQLTSWQQSIIYFSVFFLLLFALLQALEIVL